MLKSSSKKNILANDTGPHEFFHPDFNEHKPTLLTNIRRRNKNEPPNEGDDNSNDDIHANNSKKYIEAIQAATYIEKQFLSFNDPPQNEDLFKSIEELQDNQKLMSQQITDISGEFRNLTYIISSLHQRSDFIEGVLRENFGGKIVDTSSSSSYIPEDPVVLQQQSDSITYPAAPATPTLPGRSNAVKGETPILVAPSLYSKNGNGLKRPAVMSTTTISMQQSLQPPMHGGGASWGLLREPEGETAGRRNRPENSVVDSNYQYRPYASLGGDPSL